jgi:hypothetical protein
VWPPENRTANPARPRDAKLSPERGLNPALSQTPE